MTYANATTLLQLAAYVSANRFGVSFDQIEDRFGVSRRQAQRMMDALRIAFPELGDRRDSGGRKVFSLARPPACDLVALTAGQLAALDHAIEALENLGDRSPALLDLRDHLISLIPAARARRIAPDHDALLEAQGFVARPGPRETVVPAVDEAIVAALMGCRLVAFDYASGEESERTPRRVAPYGVLSGLRRYLVGQPVDRDERVRIYRLDKIAELAVLAEHFERPSDFDLQAFAKRGFGAFVKDDEYGEVVWRFVPEAAERARRYQFHPDQVLEDGPDGSLTVRFRACGHLEMCWHLYAWGDKVEVLAPDALRRMVASHRRSDFASMP